MWYLLGCRVSPKCLTALIGLGNARMGRVLSGGMDRRYRKWGGAPRFNYTYQCVSLLMFSSFA